jgi:putative transposase
VPAGWGGKREGAGRAPTLERPSPPHVSRPKHDARHPVHVTLRARQGLVSLRSERVFAVLVLALERSNRFSMRVVHYSIQQDHVHLIVEADGARALDRGLRGLTVRTARAINRTLGRSGQVWNQRYHVRALRSPREVRNALAYVLLNFRKHLRAAPGVDPRSSGPWFDGWARPPAPPGNLAATAVPRTWLATAGWRRGGGAIDWREVPSRPKT